MKPPTSPTSQDDMKYISARSIKKFILQSGVMSISAESVQSLNAIIDEFILKLITLVTSTHTSANMTPKLTIHDIEEAVGKLLGDKARMEFLEYAEKIVKSINEKPEPKNWSEIIFEDLKSNEQSEDERKKFIPFHRLYKKLNHLLFIEVDYEPLENPYFTPQTLVYCTSVLEYLTFYILNVISQSVKQQTKYTIKMEDVLQTLNQDPVLGSYFQSTIIKRRLERKLNKSKSTPTSPLSPNMEHTINHTLDRSQFETIKREPTPTSEPPPPIAKSPKTVTAEEIGVKVLDMDLNALLKSESVIHKSITPLSTLLQEEGTHSAPTVNRSTTEPVALPQVPPKENSTSGGSTNNSGKKLVVRTEKSPFTTLKPKSKTIHARSAGSVSKNSQEQKEERGRVLEMMKFLDTQPDTKPQKKSPLYKQNKQESDDDLDQEMTVEVESSREDLKALMTFLKTTGPDVLLDLETGINNQTMKSEIEPERQLLKSMTQFFKSKNSLLPKGEQPQQDKEPELVELVQKLNHEGLMDVVHSEVTQGNKRTQELLTTAQRLKPREATYQKQVKDDDSDSEEEGNKKKRGKREMESLSDFLRNTGPEVLAVPKPKKSLFGTINRKGHSNPNLPKQVDSNNSLTQQKPKSHSSIATGASGSSDIPPVPIVNLSEHFTQATTLSTTGPMFSATVGQETSPTSSQPLILHNLELEEVYDKLDRLYKENIELKLKLEQSNMANQKLIKALKQSQSQPTQSNQSVESGQEVSSQHDSEPFWMILIGNQK